MGTGECSEIPIQLLIDMYELLLVTAVIPSDAAKSNGLRVSYLRHIASAITLVSTANPPYGIFSAYTFAWQVSYPFPYCYGENLLGARGLSDQWIRLKT